MSETPERIRYGGYTLYAPGTCKNNRYWTLRGVYSGRQIHMSLKCDSLDEAQGFVDRLLALDVTDTPLASEYATTRGPVPAWARKLIEAAKQRSKKHGLPFTLSEGDIVALIHYARGRCEVTGIPFSKYSKYNVRYGSRRRPFTPSLDRIVPERGYTRDNCRLVILAVNIAMSDWGLPVLMQIARALVGPKDSRRPGEQPGTNDQNY